MVENSSRLSLLAAHLCQLVEFNMAHRVKQRCQYCRIHGCTQWTQRRCYDCLHKPALCQTTQRDCHSSRHEASFDVIRDLWFQKKNSTQTFAQELAQEPSPRGRGRLCGAINKRKRQASTVLTPCWNCTWFLK